jgi:exodeoxyribonuclease VII large subunit
VYSLPGPLEDGMKLAVRGRPHIHEQYGFSVQVAHIQPVGEGSIKKAADLLATKLESEGLFDPERKRPLPYPPQTIGLITSLQSAAYADFIKVIAARYGGLEIQAYDSQVQGEQAVADIAAGLKYFNEEGDMPDVIVITRGGGSAEDLAAFSNEMVVRAVAASRVPTLVAIGHEVDVSLAELAADARASTPSNAAELLVPDKKDLLAQLDDKKLWLVRGMGLHQEMFREWIQARAVQLTNAVSLELDRQKDELLSKARLLEILSPQSALKRGYAMVHSGNRLVRSAAELKAKDELAISFADGDVKARVE